MNGVPKGKSQKSGKITPNLSRIIVLFLACHCGKEIKTVICGTVPLNDARFNCGKLCNRMLRCETHKCKKVCHEGECELCKFLPDKAKTCWCGKTSLTLDQLCSRQSCADPLPTCDAICGKIFSCGPPLKHHSCQEKCHENSCPMCVLKTSVKCCCGSMSKEINCSQLKTKAAKFQCTKRCTKVSLICFHFFHNFSLSHYVPCEYDLVKLIVPTNPDKRIRGHS